MRFNPFRPNSIVSPEMFHGRTDELTVIQQSLFQTRYGNPQHFLIEGERGLGKLVKLLTEKLTKRGCDRLVIGMTGQPGLIEKLKASHESSSRIFTTLSLKPLQEDENKGRYQH
jgi:hypothetical protein